MVIQFIKFLIQIVKMGQDQEKMTRLIAGTLAGWSIVTVGQPLDYLKTMYQVKTHTVPSVRQIYRDIGLRGFYKGASSIYLFVGAVTALEFQTFQRVSELLTWLRWQDKHQPNVPCLMLAGAATGIISSFIYTPTEYAKILCQIQHKPTQGSAKMIFQVLRKEKLKGLRKLYTGHPITLLKQSVGSALYYGGYHATLTKVFKQKRQTAEVWSQILSGAAAGIVYQLYSYPFDTIKTNVQSGHKTLNEMLRNKFWKTLNFRNGLKLSLFRSSMVDAINFTVYENLKQLLSEKYKHYSKY